jgi:uncharacterized membrane protein
MKQIGIALFLAGVFLATYAAVSAIIAVVAMLLWNFIMTSTNHPDLQVGFWVAWAAMFLLSMIAAPFRSKTVRS